MSARSKNETWVVERGGDVVEKVSHTGRSGLTDWERLVYCLWVADYMMRNAGDFANAEGMYRDFQSDAKQFAERLGLAKTQEAFALPQKQLQQEYFERFEEICDEIKSSERRRDDT